MPRNDMTAVRDCDCERFNHEDDGIGQSSAECAATRGNLTDSPSEPPCTYRLSRMYESPMSLKASEEQIRS